jgi:adenosylcobinamide kinase/adenosylcobinamide-phosphate guanylyltransferase
MDKELSQICPNLTLITGGAKSGKSAFAEKLALQSSKLGDSVNSVYYLATMPYINGDAEQEERIIKHRLRRPADWQTIESELDIHLAVRNLTEHPSACIIDCMSLYVANIFFRFEREGGAMRTHVGPSATTADSGTVLGAAVNSGAHGSRFSALEKTILQSVQLLIDEIGRQEQVNFLVVTNEVGFSLVPDNEIGRRFRDHLGEVNQVLARAAAAVWLSCAGLQIQLK